MTDNYTAGEDLEFGDFVYLQCGALFKYDGSQVLYGMAASNCTLGDCANVEPFRYSVFNLDGTQSEVLPPGDTVGIRNKPDARNFTFEVFDIPLKAASEPLLIKP